MIKIDQLIRSRRKTIALIVQLDGRLAVRAPLRATKRQILDFVERKSAWIRSKQELALKSSSITKPKEYVSGESFWFLGQTYRLQIVENAGQLLSLNHCFCLDRDALPQAQKVFIQWYRQQARRVISERLAWYASRYGYSYRQIKITSARTRWGSCSSKRTISFTWRLVMAPLPVIDYVVVHELAHTSVKNHDKAFWSKVKAILPGYPQQAAWLKTNGALLFL